MTIFWLSWYNCYKKKPLKIPSPEFFVVYNGIKTLPQNKLSLNVNFDITPKKLDLEVTVLDINYDRLPPAILERRDTLDGYSFLVEKVRNYIQKYPLDEAIELAKQDTEKQGYLVDYLKREEFMTMLMKTWTIEDQIKFTAKESYEEGIEKGIEKAKLEGAKALLDVLDEQTIADKLGLDIETIKSLKEQS